MKQSNEPLSDAKVRELALWFRRPENWNGIRLTTEAQGDLDALSERQRIQVLTALRNLGGQPE